MNDERQPDESMTICFHCASGERIALEISSEETEEGTLYSVDEVKRF